MTTGSGSRRYRWRPAWVFISSTSDLKAERQAVADFLASIEFEADWFEVWPAAPEEPVSQCLAHVAESDALVLLIGPKYGTKLASGLSATHLEVREAIARGKRIFAYLLPAASREPEMEALITEVQPHATYTAVSDLDGLKEAVRATFLSQFAKLFRDYTRPPETPPKATGAVPEVVSEPLPADAAAALADLDRLYEEGKDKQIFAFREQIAGRFSDDREILNLFYMSAVNLAMAGYDVPSRVLLSALDLWEVLVRERPEAQPGIDYCRGNALGTLGRKVEAIERYRAALATVDFAMCRINLANALRDEDRREEAREEYARALAMEPTRFEALYCMATLKLVHERQPDEALSYLARIDLDSIPDRHATATRRWLASAYLDLGRFDEALPHIEDVLRVAPDFVPAWEVAARFFVVARRDDSKYAAPALGFWRAFTGRFPDQGGGWAELGYTCLQIERASTDADLVREAKRAFERALALNFDDRGMVADRLGHIHQDRGDWAKAAAAYEIAAARDAPSFGYSLGVALTRLGRYAEALPLVRAAAEQYQPDALSWFQVGACELNLGNYFGAIRAYERAVELDPDYDSAHYDLGGAYYHAGNFAAARRVWTSALERFPNHEAADRAREFLRDLDRGSSPLR